MSNLEHRVELSIGDWSRDGHNISESIFIMSSLTGKEMEEAYKKGVEVTGIDVVENLCAEYEDNLLSKEMLEKFISHGLKWELSPWDQEHPEETTINMDVDGFVEIYLFTVKLGEPTFEYAIVKPDYENVVRIGGYGLFVT